MSRTYRIGWQAFGATMVLLLGALCVLAVEATAQPVPASQAATVAPALDPHNLTGVVATMLQAFGNQSWPVFVMSLIVVVLGYERHWQGLTGPKVSAWLGSRRGIFATSLLSAVATAGLSVATGGWKAIGYGCLVALVIGAINGGVQLVGPAATPAISAAPDQNLPAAQSER